jgi:hypothetical protein
VFGYSRMTLVTRIVARILMTLQRAEAGDHRNWSLIRTWATDPTSSRHAA